MTAQSNITPESIVADLRYLQLLSRSFLPLPLPVQRLSILKPS